MVCGLSGSSVRGILQAKILEWIAIPFSRGSSWPRDLLTKKYSHNLKVELFYLMEMFRTPSLGDSISVALRKVLQRGRRGTQALYKFATKGAGSLNIKDQVWS